jgi:hypothetical protein
VQIRSRNRAPTGDTTMDFPPLLDGNYSPWQWPEPPFAWRFEVPAGERVEPCRIDTRSGGVVDGEMLAIDADAARIQVRMSAAGSPLSLPFSQFYRLTLTTPLQPIARAPGAPVERLPAAAQEREVCAVLADGSELVTRSAGHVENGWGLFLYPPVDVDRSLLRQFLPRGAWKELRFGPSAEELAMKHWIADPGALLDALDRQATAPVLPLGEALLHLGLVTPQQIEAMLARQSADRSLGLGEMLVAAGLLSRGDLQTAFGHKMGCPLVDLMRFPIDPAAARRLTLRTVVMQRALPIMVDGRRLIVAVDRLSRVANLSTLQALAGMTIVPVMVRKAQLRVALTALVQQDVWSQAVPAQVAGMLDTLN